MPQTLSLTYDEIRQRVGKIRGYGDVVDSWTAKQVKEIAYAVQDGYREFLKAGGYDWSFLQPLAPLTILEGSSELLLPADFAFPASDIYFVNPQWGSPLIVQGSPRVLAMRQETTDSTGRPQYGAILPVGPPKYQAQRQELIFWPTADQEYSIQLQYSVLSVPLSADNPYPYGGQAHADTILEACFAASERSDSVMGPHQELYQRALAASMEYDRRVKPQHLGPKRRGGWAYEPVTTYVPRV